MLSFLKNHPFAVEAFFEDSIVLTFAFPKEKLQTLIPECLELDTLKDTWAFIAVAMVNTKKLRPKGFPAFIGRDFSLVGYRIFVRYTNTKGKRLRGLYILKSETDKKMMELMGNLFTHYSYTTTDFTYKQETEHLSISSLQSDFYVDLNTRNEDIQLPEGSPFKDWKEARRFAGPLPFTFTYKKDTKEVFIIEGVREDWIPNAIEVKQFHFSFLDALQLGPVLLANAFIIRKIPYYWKKGKIEQWKA